VIKDKRVLIQDLKSRNGTFVNDKRLPTDRAKVLKSGDQLRIGKLEFELLIEHGLQGAKRPEVSGMGDAAERMAEAGSHESKFESVDVNAWLDEADQIDRVRKMSDPETRQFQIDRPSEAGSSADSEVAGDDSSELSVSDSSDGIQAADDSKSGKREKKKPGKLPEGYKKAMTENSRDAADDALKRFFSGR